MMFKCTQHRKFFPDEDENRPIEEKIPDAVRKSPEKYGEIVHYNHCKRCKNAASKAYHQKRKAETGNIHKNPTRAAAAITWNNRVKKNTDLTQAEFIELYTKSTHCALTGIEFTENYHKDRSTFLSPFNRSVDQIIPGEGYYRNNIQIICNITNSAKGEYTIEELLVFCRAMVKKYDVM